MTIVVALAAAGVAWWEIQSPHAGRNGLRTITFMTHSRLLHRDLSQEAVVPERGGAGRPLLVMLHGRGGSPKGEMSNQLFAVLQSLGRRAPDVVAVDGGDASYYHDRQDGPWGSYVVKEAIPQAIALLHADPHRVAIAGTSMGAFGELDIARLWPRRFCAVGGNSPAIFLFGAQSAAGAFDDAEDFPRHDLLAVARADPRIYGRIPLWIDTGTEDFFRQADTEFAHLLRGGGEQVTFHVWPGGHAEQHWDGHFPLYIQFFARALAGCGNDGVGFPAS